MPNFFSREVKNLDFCVKSLIGFKKKKECMVEAAKPNSACQVLVCNFWHAQFEWNN